MTAMLQHHAHNASVDHATAMINHLGEDNHEQEESPPLPVSADMPMLHQHAHNAVSVDHAAAMFDQLGEDINEQEDSPLLPVAADLPTSIFLKLSATKKSLA